MRLSETIFKKAFVNNSARMYSMQANKNYEDTEFHQAYTVNADAAGFYFVDDDMPERILKSFFAATAAYLSGVKVAKADEAVALVLVDVTGAFKFAAIVEYHENKEDPSEPGNWSYINTLNKKDVDELEKKKTVTKYLCGDMQFRSVFESVAYDIGCFRFSSDTYAYDSSVLLIDTLLQVLDREAKEGEVVDIELPGYFTASVAIEDGEKIFAITPDGHLKAVVKGDVQLEDK